MELAYSLWPAQVAEKAKILLLHGMGGTGALWRPVAAALEADFSLLAPDQRGHGRSQIPSAPGGRDEPEYSPLEYGQDIVETMDRLDFHPTWIVGHSMGVRSACAAAHLKPAWVKGLILVDLGFYGPAGGGLGQGLASFLAKLPLEFASRQDARDFMTRECPDPSIAQYLMAVSVKASDGQITFPFDRAALIQTIHAAQNVSVRGWVEELGKRGTPVLVLRGAESGVWSHAEFKEEQARFSAYSSITFREVSGAGHGLPFEKRLEFVQIIRDLISS